MPAFNDKYDRYGFTKDADLNRLLEKMLSRDTFVRPDVKEVLNDRFIKKWTRRSPDRQQQL